MPLTSDTFPCFVSLSTCINIGEHHFYFLISDHLLSSYPALSHNQWWGLLSQKSTTLALLHVDTDPPVIQTTGKWSITGSLTLPPPWAPSILLISRNPSIRYHMHMNMTWWAPVLYWFPSFVQLIQNYLASRQQCNNGVSPATFAVVSGVSHARIDTRPTLMIIISSKCFYHLAAILSPMLMIFYSIALYHLLLTTSWHQLTD